MKTTLSSRVAYITRVLKQYGFRNITLKTYRPGINPYSGYFRIYALKENIKIYITELLINGKIAKYSYTLLQNNNVTLRYDNGPHHPEVPTHPHHKHVREEILEAAKTVGLSRNWIQKLENTLKQHYP